MTTEWRSAVSYKTPLNKIIEQIEEDRKHCNGRVYFGVIGHHQPRALRHITEALADAGATVSYELKDGNNGPVTVGLAVYK